MRFTVLALVVDQKTGVMDAEGHLYMFDENGEHPATLVPLSVDDDAYFVEVRIEDVTAALLDQMFDLGDDYIAESLLIDLGSDDVDLTLASGKPGSYDALGTKPKADRTYGIPDRKHNPKRGGRNSRRR